MQKTSAVRVCMCSREREHGRASHLRCGKKPLQHISVEFIRACPAGGYCSAFFSCFLVLLHLFFHRRLDLRSQRVILAHSTSLCFPERDVAEAVVLAQSFAQHCLDRPRRTHYTVARQASFHRRLRATNPHHLLGTTSTLSVGQL